MGHPLDEIDQIFSTPIEEMTEERIQRIESLMKDSFQSFKMKEDVSTAKSKKDNKGPKLSEKEMREILYGENGLNLGKPK